LRKFSKENSRPDVKRNRRKEESASPILGRQKGQELRLAGRAPLA